MEVLNDRVSMLTNYEVLQLLNESKKEEAAKPKHEKCKLLGQVTHSTLNYLKGTPGVCQNAEKIAEVVKKLAPFHLTAAETLQVINLRPSTTTEIQLIVEESEERLKTEEQLNALIEVVTETLPAPAKRSA